MNKQMAAYTPEQLEDANIAAQLIGGIPKEKSYVAEVAVRSFILGFKTAARMPEEQAETAAG